MGEIRIQWLFIFLNLQKSTGFDARFLLLLELNNAKLTI